MKTLKVKMLLITFTALLILFGSTTNYVQAHPKNSQLLIMKPTKHT